MKSRDRAARGAVLLLFVLPFGAALLADPPGEQPALGFDRVTQADLASMSLAHIRDAGLRVFATSFNQLDGYGDGPSNPGDPTSPGGRPTLQGNGMLLRVNGLDAQSCFDCHGLVSAATVPPTMGVGGAGSANTNVMAGPTTIDVSDQDADGIASFNGRFINPPFVFGAGGVELLAIEMTEELQALQQQALVSPGTVIDLVTKGVSFGTIVADAFGELDTSGVEGIDDDLVVRPFGRKGGFATTREFDLGAMAFHFGMQPAEVVGPGVDDDGDGVADEILIGEMSALSVFMSTIDRPEQDRVQGIAAVGENTFQAIGCTGCHVPSLQTVSTDLPLRQPELPTDPRANVYMEIDLTRPPVHFERNDAGGIEVELFADLKRHDMGPGLAEDNAGADPQQNSEFTTARLWGVADTAPYMHDGRALTLTQAILMHGGEGAAARDAFDALDDSGKESVLEFLRTLRTPRPTPPSGPNRSPRFHAQGGAGTVQIDRR